MSRLNLVVLGAGAIGCYVGARLAAAGASVSLVGRSRVIEALKPQGLRVSDQQGFDTLVAPERLHLALSLAEALALLPAGQRPVVLVCTKATGTEAAAQDSARDCAPGTVVVSLQNGVDNAQRLQAGAPLAKVLAGMVPFTVNWRGDQHVYQANSGSLQIASDEGSEALAQTLREAGVGVVLHDQMQGILWGKLLFNLINPINALVNIPIRAQMLERDDRRVLAALQDEALNVLRAAGIQPAKLAAVAPHWVPRILRLPNWLFERVAAGMLKTDAQARTSMCEDLQQGRATEIDDLCGAVLKLARLHGVAAPLNERLRALILAYKPGDRWTGKRLRQALGV